MFDQNHATVPFRRKESLESEFFGRRFFASKEEEEEIFFWEVFWGRLRPDDGDVLSLSLLSERKRRARNVVRSLMIAR